MNERTTSPDGAPSRALGVDDHPAVLGGVTFALQDLPWPQVVGHAHSGRQAVDEIDRLRPDVVLLDLRLPDMLAPEIVRAIRRRDRHVRIVVFTAFPDHAALQATLAAGVAGVVVKDAERADLVDILRRIMTGERMLGDEPGPDATILINRKLRDHGLTRREYEILRHVAMGETNPEIAAALGLTRNTVKTYLQRTMEKLMARNRVEALSRANQLGIL